MLLHSSLCGSILLIYCISNLVVGDDEYAMHSHHKEHFHEGTHDPTYDKNIILGSMNSNDLSKMSLDEAKQKLSYHLGNIDLDGNGLVNKQEISSFVFNYFRKADEKEASEKLLDVDTNSDKHVEWDEYVRKVYGYELSEIEEFKKDISPEMTQFLKLVLDDLSRFKIADLDFDGKLSSTEYGAFLHPSNYDYMHDYEINLTLSQIDKDEDGFITFDEYLGESTPMDEQRMVDHENFLSYDSNYDGKLDRNEVRVWLLPNKKSMADEEAEHLVGESDADGDGELSFQEVIDKYDLWMGSAATQYGNGLQHDPSEL